MEGNSRVFLMRWKDYDIWEAEKAMREDVSIQRYFMDELTKSLKSQR